MYAPLTEILVTNIVNVKTNWIENIDINVPHIPLGLSEWCLRGKNLLY